ncbi:DEAD/DEAH box helicase [Idiomarina baltica]|uniref:DEAD/DEAH box helicase n=1 Tax=Idiomarina baltica TaxID=190892 RepID=UPI002FDDDEEE
MTIDAFADKSPEQTLKNLVSELLKKGPEKSSILEKLAYYKLCHPSEFARLEEEILSVLGLFYKLEKPKSLLSLALSTFEKQYIKDFGHSLTPVQASIRYALQDFQSISISAPTSAGKSYAIRDYLKNRKKDSVIIIPSRALVDEYLQSMRELFDGDKNVLISPFVDNVFKSRDLRRVFVLTPERARELFRHAKDLEIGDFFFDEAQISEDIHRGIGFDILISRVRNLFPTARFIFAHPFVANPEAQIEKFKLDTSHSFSRAYNHGSVGRICVYKHGSNQNYYYFSPYEKNGHHIKNCQQLEYSFKDFAFNGEKTVLVYVSKASIYSGKYIKSYEKYIDSYQPVKSETANEIIDLVEETIGSDQNDYTSNLVELMKKGVVIHHGSVPLDVRFLIEKFINDGFARVCFATSTLAQGINMPFDIVWLDSMSMMGETAGDRSLAFKNLIGRSGRLSKDAKFDYGYVFTEKPKKLSERIQDQYTISQTPIIERDINDFDEEQKEDVKSLKNDTFDEDLYAPKSRAERLSDASILEEYVEILDLLYKGNNLPRENLQRYGVEEAHRLLIDSLKTIYETYINRQLLNGELEIFKQAIRILFAIIAGASFKKIAKIRFAYITNIKGGKKGSVKFLQPASHIPDLRLKYPYPLFPKGTKASDVNYDALVYDTYDYFDHVISFSISEKIICAFRTYRRATGDTRADKMVNLLRFGTNDNIETLLLRYGFPGSVIKDVMPYVSFIDEYNINFKDITGAPEHVLKAIEWYLP